MGDDGREVREGQGQTRSQFDTSRARHSDDPGMPPSSAALPELPREVVVTLNALDPSDPIPASLEDSLDELFPDGEWSLGSRSRAISQRIHPLEASLQRADLVQLRLRTAIQALRAESAELRQLLEQDGGAERMATVQESVGVSTVHCLI
jgi:hypothetical protein